MPASHIAQGKHLLLDLYGADHLSDIEFIDTQLCEAARICGATILRSHFHSFDGGMASQVWLFWLSLISVFIPGPKFSTPL